MENIQIKSLGYSGFILTFDRECILFDPTLKEVKDFPSREYFDSFEHVYVFFSTAGSEHYDPQLFDLCGENAHFILSEDIDSENGIKMKAGDTITVENTEVTAYPSTDTGISYLVSFRGLTLFHAGTLNLWHWKDSSSIAEIKEAENKFYDIVNQLPVNKIDLAFFPIDTRQISVPDAGARYFTMTVKPKIFIPMNFFSRFDAVTDFCQAVYSSQTKVIMMKYPNDTVKFVFDSERAED